MKDKKTDVLNGKGEKIGHILTHRAPAFAGGRLAYSAVGLNGEVLGLAQSNRNAALELFKS